jgi:hypothetical protein
LYGSLLETDAFYVVMQEITPLNLLMISATLILYYLPPLSLSAPSIPCMYEMVDINHTYR